MLNARDRQVLVAWLRSGATLAEVEAAESVGLVENVRFSEDARRAYRFLWLWSAHRFGGVAGRKQNDVYCRGGMVALERRFARVGRIIARLKAGG